MEKNSYRTSFLHRNRSGHHKSELNTQRHEIGRHEPTRNWQRTQVLQKGMVENSCALEGYGRELMCSRRAWQRTPVLQKGMVVNSGALEGYGSELRCSRRVWQITQVLQKGMVENSGALEGYAVSAPVMVTIMSQYINIC